MKRLNISLCLVLIFILVACGGDDDPQSNTVDVENNTSSVSDDASPEPTLMPEPDLPALEIEQIARIGTGNLRDFGGPKVESQQWSPDSSTFALATTAGVMLFDATDFSAEPRFLDIPGGAVRLLYHPDGTQLVVTEGGGDGFGETFHIRVYDTTTYDLITRLETEYAIVDLMFSEDGSTLLGGGIQLYEWDTTTYDELVSYYAWEDGNAYAVALNPTDNGIYFVASRNLIYEFDRTTNTPTLLWDTEEAIERDIEVMRFNPDGTQLATATSRNVYIWDVATQEIITTSEADRVHQMEWTEEEGLIGYARGETVNINLETGESTILTTGFSRSPENPRLSPDGRFSTNTRPFRQLEVLDLETGEIVLSLTFGIYDQYVLLAPDNSWMVAFSANANTLTIFDPTTFEILQTLDIMGQLGAFSANSVRLSPDASLLAVGSGKHLQVFDTTIWEAVFEGQDFFEQDTYTLYFTPDGTQLIYFPYRSEIAGQILTISADGTSIEVVGEIPVLEDFVSRGVFVGEDHSQLLVRLTNSFTSYVYDLSTDPIADPTPIEIEDRRYMDFAQLPDGQVIAMGGGSFVSNSFWAYLDGETFLPTEQIEGLHLHRTLGGAVNVAGTRLITVGNDNFIRVWDLETNSLIGEFDVLHERGQEVVMLNDDGTRFITTSDDRVLRVWEISEP